MTAVVVVATIRPLPEHRAAVVSAFEQVIAQVHAEDAGCLLYALHEDDDTLVMLEKWASAEDLKSHSRGAALKKLNADLAGKLSGAPDVKVFRPRPAGTAEQGTL